MCVGASSLLSPFLVGQPMSPLIMALAAFNNCCDNQLKSCAIAWILSLYPFQAGICFLTASRPGFYTELLPIASPLLQVGFIVGDILAQKITGGDGIDAFRSFQLGSIGAGLDIFRQEFSGKAEDVKDGKLAQAAKAVTSQASWGPIIACGMYAAIKVAEGNPGEIVQGVEVRSVCLVSILNSVTLCIYY